MTFTAKVLAGLLSAFLIAQVSCQAKGGGGHHGGGGHGSPSLKSAPPPPAPTKIVNGNPVNPHPKGGRHRLGRGRHIGGYVGDDTTNLSQQGLDVSQHPGSNATVDPNLPASSFVKTYN